MSELDEFDGLVKAATTLIEVLEKADNLADQVYPEEIVNIVKLHAKLATASALIPIPGVDLVASATSIWSMYVRLNNKLEIPFQEKCVKNHCFRYIYKFIRICYHVGCRKWIKINTRHWFNRRYDYYVSWPICYNISFRMDLY